MARSRDQISDLQERLAQTEPHGSNGDGPSETREMLLRTLVLAQRTADAAISDARSEAKSITDSAQERAAKTVAEAEAAANERLRSSEERADQTLAEAEENCQLILNEAKRTAAAELATERARKIEEIEALEATRADLEATTAAIQARLDSERSQLRSLAVSFQSFVEQFEPVTDPGDSVGPPIEAVGSDEDMETDGAMETDDSAVPGADELVTKPEDAAGHDAEPEPAIEFSLHPDDEAIAEHDPGDDAEPAEATAAEPTERATAVENAGDALVDPLTAETLTADALPDLPPVRWAGEDANTANTSSHRAYPTGPIGAEQAHQPSADPHPRTEPHTVAAPATHSPKTRSPELFDIEAEEDDEFIEQLRQVVSSDAPLPGTDAAMAAFFDHDEGTGRGGRMGQRA